MADRNVLPANAVSSDSGLKKTLTRTQSIGIFTGFGAVLIVLALYTWFNHAANAAEQPYTPVEMPAVISQGEDEINPTPQPTASSQEEAVRQETLHAMRDQARSAPIEN